MSGQHEDPPDEVKIDPETLALRGEATRPVRFKKSVVVGFLATGSLALVGVAWLGLRPTTFKMVAEPAGKFEVAVLPDALVDAPKSYGDVARLGPPLPGDLGRPILAHERAMAQPDVGIDRAAEAAEAERQRIAADLKAARESAVMMQVGRPAMVLAAGGDARVPSGEGDMSSSRAGGSDLEQDANGQQRKAAFLSGTGASSDENPHRLARAPSPYTLSAGSIIAASLITGLNSDLPGFVTAQVTENAYDSVTGKILLVPQGARLIGRYDSVIAFGQSRALLVWERIMMPDGGSIRINNMPATDAAGYMGLSDSIDRHSWQILRGVVLSTLLGVGAELSLGNNDGDLVSALRRSAQQSGARAGDMLVGKSLNIQPTVKVRPGWPLRVIVNKDLVLRPWKGEAW